jgi:hypothetical protein
MKGYVNICSYVWTYTVSVDNNNVVHAGCHRNSGPVNKYTGTSFPLSDLCNTTLRDKVETHITQWAETNGA